MIPTLSFFSPGSANSMVMNGSIKSSADDDAPVDGDNINVVIRVRPLNAREVKNDDYNILQFPGDGGIWVSQASIFGGLIVAVVVAAASSAAAANKSAGPEAAASKVGPYAVATEAVCLEADAH